MPTKATFEGFSYAIRIVEGLGTSAGVTASGAIVGFTFPDNVGTALVMPKHWCMMETVRVILATP